MNPGSFPAPDDTAAAAPPGAALRLRGKNLALLCDDAGGAAVAAFEAAAQRLGARVSRVAAHGALLDPGHARDTARMLGRLYDGIAGARLSEDAAQQLQRDSGVPVIRLQAGDAAEGGPQRLQALLLHSLG